jgi:hypothetical protein
MTDKIEEAKAPEVKTIFAQVRAPRGANDPGAAVEGAYVLEDGAVVLTNRDGVPVRDERGKHYRHTLAPNDNPRQIAARMTKEFRSALRGKAGAPLAGFEYGPLRYPPIKVV